MKKFQCASILIILAALLLSLSSMQVLSAPALAPQTSGTSFHFVFAADSRGNYTVLPAFSHKMVTLSPIFGFFAGDLCSTFDTTCINNQWKPAMDGNNKDGMLARTFVSRGNHDSGALSTWQGLWDFQGMASRLGATRYKAQTSDATYSFDYGNSHFVVVDNPSSGARGWTSTQISWLDSDLAAAESRGKVHEFLIVHGSMYTVTSEHATDLPSSSLKAVLNKHPRLIGFHGHEHVSTYTLVTPSFESGINKYPQFTLGRAGAPAYPVEKPVTWKADQNAFGDVAISGTTVTVRVYSQSGSLLYTRSFSHSAVVPTPSTAKFLSTAAYDGYVLETSELSSQGGAPNSTGTVFRLGDDASNRQYRGFLSFNTAALPDNAVISSVMLKIKQAGSGGADPYNSLGSLVVDIMKGAFGGSISLQAGDFQAAASRSAAMSIPNTPTSGWYSKALGSAFFGYINKTGVTQLRLRFSSDDNNNGLADYLSFYTGETATSTDRATLVIKYTLP